MRGAKSILSYVKRTDKIYWLLILTISAYSLLILKTLPSPAYFKTQLMFMICGYLGAIMLTLIDYREISSFWYVVAGFCLFLMLYTLVFGKEITNSGGVHAKAWIVLPGGRTFQPCELVKIGFMITFSKHLSALKEHGLMKNPLHIVLLACHALIPMALVHLQGDDGAGIIFFCMFLAMAFAAGVQLRYFAVLLATIAAAVPIAWKLNILSVYQKKRILVTYNLESDKLNYGFHQIQGRLSIGSGRMWGRGLFVSPRVNKNVVPIQQSDFIFSVVGEQLGFVGCVAVILLLLFLLWRTLHVARKSQDLLGSSICMGFFGMIAAQTIFNLGMCVDLLPVMGVTLPFFSAGGSSVMSLCFGFGLVINVHMHKVNMDKVSIKRNI